MFFRLLVSTIVIVNAMTIVHAQSIVLDGKLEESEWQQGTQITLDKTINPFSLSLPEQPSKATLLALDTGIYIGVVTEQPRHQQTTVRTPRDAEIESDYVRIIIDFDNGKSNAYSFDIGNGGAIRDGIWRDENQFSNEWDGRWYAKTRQTPTHWYAEVLIPWDTVPMKKVQGAQRALGLFVERHNVFTNKSFSHIATSSQQPRFISQFATTAVQNYDTSTLDAFASITLLNATADDSTETNLSLDVFWRPDTSQQLSLTLNPDFGQAEADNLVVNFTPYESFFSERRAFFTQNQGLFDVRGRQDLRLIHTRRMGAEADIDGAIKYTKNADAYDLGVMAVVEEDDQYGQRGNGYLSARGISQLGQTQLGYTITHTDSVRNHRKATVQAVDWQSNLSDSLQFSGLVVGSQVDITEGDNTEDNGFGTSLSLSHKLSDTRQQALKLAYYDDNLSVNDSGFLPRNDIATVLYEYKIQWNDFAENSGKLKRSDRWFAYAKVNSDGENLGSIFQYTQAIEYASTAAFDWRLNYFGRGEEDRIGRGLGNVIFEDGVEAAIGYNWGNQHKFRHQFTLVACDRADDGKAIDFYYSPTYYFNDDYRLSWDLWTVNAKEKLIWQFDGLNRFDFRQINNGFNFDASLGDKQEFRLRFEWLSYRGDNGIGLNVSEQGDLSKAAAVGNIGDTTTRLQLRYRYEIAPLSNIYVVYSRGGGGYDTNQHDVWQTLSEGWNTRDGDNLLVKMRYHF